MKLKSKWVYSYQKGLRGAMVSYDYHIDGDDLYYTISLGLSDLRSLLIKLNLKTQEGTCIFEEKHVLRTAGLVDDGKMFLTSMKGMAYCVDFDGNMLWESAIGKGMASFKMAMDDQNLYVTNNGVYCLNKENGEIRWKNEASGKSFNCNKLLDGQRLYSGQQGGEIICLDRKTGDTIWSSGKDEWISYVEKIGEDRLLVNHNHGWFYLIDTETGALITKMKANGWLNHKPVIENNRLYIGDGNHVINSTSGNMTCYEILPDYTLREIYKVSVEGGGVSTEACLYDDMLFFATENGYLYCIDKNTGSAIMARKKCKGECRNIIIRDDEIILLTDKGQVECFEFIR